MTQITKHTVDSVTISSYLQVVVTWTLTVLCFSQMFRKEIKTYIKSSGEISLNNLFRVFKIVSISFLRKHTLSSWDSGHHTSRVMTSIRITYMNTTGVKVDSLVDWYRKRIPYPTIHKSQDFKSFCQSGLLQREGFVYRLFPDVQKRTHYKGRRVPESTVLDFSSRTRTRPQSTESLELRRLNCPPGPNVYTQQLGSLKRS